MSHASALCADRERNIDPVRHRGKDRARTPDIGHDGSRQERIDLPWTTEIKAAAAKVLAD